MAGLILVTGVSSLPGYKTALRLVETKGSVIGVYNQHPVSGVPAVKWDLVSDAAGLVAQYKPSVIIHIAGMGDVDGCEVNPELCHRVNTVATRELAKAAYRVGARLIYLSTDYVFDGSRGMYKESDSPRPVNYYGLSKLLGEEAVLAVGGAVVRVAWIYGLGPGKVNFGKSVVEKLSRGEEVKAIVDQWGSPTLNTLIGEVMARLVDREFEGVLHAAGPRLSRFEFAMAIAKFFGFQTSLVKPISVRDLNYRAQRPRDSSLDSSMAVKMLGVPINDLNYALSIFKGEWEGLRYAGGVG